ncbi:ImmA/IrrE family metallo-endopeptidase [Paenibacillus agricola]|uniref:ImmA/IrrE family metallo-endopeptidase n=1 Tax=Paenibacillus agricola TaxID=2716264 RepID=A0ABX0JAJ5_9BACL|nr:ImmA/IrrE family metallo-endopeptidase [Paenibacillus agricola]NHN33502.1 ImmA/IrrE family metallo-endopeptidase [Paenibacillus agricola]
MDIRIRVKNIYAKHRTNCPFRLAKLLKVSIVYLDLPEQVKGYCMRVLRRKYIILNSNLTEDEQRFICAHELGHLLLHKGFSHYFITRKTQFVLGKYELQANQFAVELLIPDEFIQSGVTIYEAANTCGVPQEVAHLKSLTR